MKTLFVVLLSLSSLSCTTSKPAVIPTVSNSEYSIQVPDGWAVYPTNKRPEGTEVYDNVVVLLNPTTQAIVVVGLLPEKVPSLRIVESLTLVAAQRGFVATEPSFSSVVENGTTLEVFMDGAMVRFLILDGPNKTIVIQGQTPLNRISYESIDTLLSKIKVKR